jgi:dTDP-4-dehydrorhamnose 3,5-epimerase
MHYQLPPFAETKLVRCMRGTLYDVIIDLRPDSRTFLQWVAVELSAENGRTLYVPKGFAHGFQTLEDNTEAFYQMSEFYASEHSRGVRWNDPLFDIAWPAKVSSLSEKDQARGC